MEPASAIGFNLLPRDFGAFLHQSGLYCRVERHQLTWWGVGAYFIYSHDQLLDMATITRKPFASKTMVTRTGWLVHQYRSRHLFSAPLVLRFLASRDSSDSSVDELVSNDVRSCPDVCIIVVVRQSSTCLYWASHADDAARLSLKQKFK